MNQLSMSLGTIVDLTLFLFGFGFIVFIHEMGHFLAARWAGIRVLAFAIGFGPAMLSYRRGMGFRQGSSEAEYRKYLAQRHAGTEPAGMGAFSPTEYRLNWLPFGGYVKMLGQDDMHPDAVSSASDSYQSVKPWKRMIVISAGVVMNIILAGVLFVVVFMAGMRTEPPIVGRVFPGKPAARAIALNAREAGVKEPGLLPGDHILRVEDKAPREFSEVVLETTMAERGHAVSMEVQRDGVKEPLRFSIVPETSLQTGLLEIGIEPPRSAMVLRSRTDAERQDILALLDQAGLHGVQPGMTLIGTSSGTRIGSFAEADRLLRESNGSPVSFTFANLDAGGHATDSVTVRVSPEASMQTGFVETPRGVTPVGHLLGLMPVMSVENADLPPYSRGHDQGLRTGDVFARVGNIEYPSLPAGMAEIKSYKGKSIPLTLLRRDEHGVEHVVQVSAEVTRNGTIGFGAGDTRDRSAMVSLPPSSMMVPPVGGGGDKKEWTHARPPAADVVTTPGLRIDMVGGHTVSNLSEVRGRLRDATRRAFESGKDGTVVALAVTLPGDEGTGSFGLSSTIEWTLSRDSLMALHELGWDSPLPSGLFEPEEFVLRASGPLEAVRFGVERTHAVMMNTYLTFVRLFQQTVKIEHLKGPVGIAHLGTLIAESGLVKMLFFLALISVNLAVVNFLPLPIVDGGQFLFLLYEQLRGRPAPIAFQNVVTLAGMALIGTMFLLVTFNDVKNLLGL